MALVLDATMQGETANAFCDVAFADDYFASNPVSSKADSWNLLTDDQKASALIQATFDIDKLRFTVPSSPQNIHLFYDNVNHRYFYASPAVDGDPVRANPFQALQFPRNIDVNTSGQYFMQPRLQIATCEQALHLATLDPTTLVAIDQGVRTDNFQGGGIVTQTSYRQDAGTTIHPFAKNWIKSYILRYNLRLERG